MSKLLITFLLLLFISFSNSGLWDHCPPNMFVSFCRYPDGMEVPPNDKSECPEGSVPICECMYWCPDGPPDENCSCCRDIKQCGDGYEYDLDECRCKCVRKCPIGYFLDVYICSCKQCINTCPENHHHGPQCGCQCSLNSCPYGKKLDDCNCLDCPQCEFTCKAINDCTLNGLCLGTNNCSCFDGWKGDDCSQFHCQSLNDCNGNGECIGPSICSCFAGYEGTACNNPICYGISNSSFVCNGRGSCVAPDQCVCNENYFGPQCELDICFGKMSNDSEVCSGHGNCTTTNECSCKYGWTGNECELPVCFGKNASDPLVCFGRGSCKTVDQCSCSSGYTGNQCQEILCFGKNSSDVNVCSKNGNCVSPDTCVCTIGWTGLECQIPICFEKLANDTKVCSNNGICIAPNSCLCSYNWTGLQCQIPICFGKNQSDSSVCNGKGDCIAPDQCQCSTNWTGSNCDIPICYGIPGNELSVCSGRGECTTNFTCICHGFGFYGEQCEFSMCEELNDCNNNGICVGIKNCSCYSGWHGEKCDEFNCIQVNDCSDKGVCIGPNNCSCLDGWTGSDCNIPICYGKAAKDPSVCHGRGTCSAPNNCTCTGSYTGADCEVFYCFGKNQSDPNVCSSNGKCESPDHCVCNEDYGGLNCEHYCPAGKMEYAIFTPDGHKKIKFNHKVNISKIGNDCSDIFINNSFGNQAKCNFLDELTLDITLGDSFSIRIGDYVTLKNNSIRVESICESFVNGKIRVDPPPNMVIVKPTVILVGPPKLSVCQDLLLDASSSFASTPLTFHWNLIQSADFVFSSEILALVQSLKSPKIEIPNHMFTINGKYNFEVTIVDRFGQSEKSSIIVEFVNSGYVPHVKIKGPSTIIINAGEELLLEGTASFSDCVDITGMKLEYIWSNQGKILSSHGGNLYIKRFQITPGIYTFNLLVNLANIETKQIVESASKFTFVEVRVNEAPVQARIKGAMNRQVPSISTIPFILDGSESRDLGMPIVPSNAVYIWKCCKRIGDICDFKEGALAFPDLESTTSSEYSRIGSISSPLPIGIFEFYLTFQIGTKSDTTSITVNIVNENVPIIFIEQLETQNQDRPLRLFGKVITNSKHLSFQWTTIEGNINLSDPKIVPYGNDKQELFIEKGYLLDSKYVFRLWVTTEDGSGYADTTIFVNHAPIGGSLSIHPTTVTSTDLPLQYTFYKKQESEFDHIWIPLNLYPQLSNEIKFRAPIVSVPTTYTFMVEAVDNKGAKRLK